MRRGALALVVFFVLSTVPVSSAQDPVLAKLVERIAIDRMYGEVDSLCAFTTRRSDQPGGFQAQDWLYARFETLGFASPDLYLHDFDANADNVVAVLPGLVAPGEIYVIGAHYDSFNGGGPTSPAPGADDNASGTAALIEIARVVKESGIGFEATIKFVAFASEELGVIGSARFVQDAIDRGEAPKNGIAMDVMGYLEPSSVRNIAYGTSEEIAGSAELETAAQTAIDTYLPGSTTETGLTCL
jgi:Zn-dependent M28 family amino/carboxypeptidase